jgi:CBS-domain-containing membrane protein
MLTEGELTGGRLRVTCAPDASLVDVMRALTKNKVHRVYAVDAKSGAALRVVTHSDLIRFFAMFAPAEEGEGLGEGKAEPGEAEACKA